MSLVAHWKLNGDARDYVGENDGTEVGTVVYSDEKLNQCYDNSAGASVGIQLMPHAVADQFTYGQSWSLWFKSNSGSESNNTQRILSRDFSEYGPRLSVDQNVNPNTLNYVSATINVGQWYHIALTSDDGVSFDWYLDGVFIGSTTEPLTGSSRPFVIGGNTEGDGDVSGNHFNGYIDDVRLYDHKLSVSEVKKLARGLTLHYKFNSRQDDNDGYVSDSSGQDFGVDHGADPPVLSEESALGRYCYEFTTPDVIEAPSTFTYPHSWSDPFTIAAWVYIPSSAPTATGFLSNIIGRGNYDGSHGLYRSTGSNDVGIYIRSDSGSAQTIAQNAPRDTWFHLCGTWDGSEAKIYYNGVLQDTSSISTTGTPATSQLTIGGRVAYAGGNGDYFEGKLDDVRFYCTAIDADAAHELYSTKASIDKGGTLHSPVFEHNVGANHGRSMWYCFEGGTATYSAIYPGTEIIEVDSTNAEESVIVSKTLNPESGTFTITEGNFYYATRPIHIKNSGYDHRLIPLSLKGKIFGNYSTRYASSIYNLYAVEGDATVNVYDAVANGINGTPSTTINIQAGEDSGYITATENDWVFFESDANIIMSVEESSNGDKMIMAPASNYFYRRYNQYETTVIGTTPSNVATHGVSDPDYKCVAVGIADGSGGDADSGLGLNNLACNYSWGDSLSDYQLVSPYDCTIDVSYWDGSSWQLGESHTLNGTLTSPDGEFRDGTVGFGSPGTDNSGAAANLGAGATLWKFEGDKPFLVVINDAVNDEEVLLGWDSTERVFSPEQTGASFRNISAIGPSRGLAAWWPLKNNLNDYTGNRNDGSGTAVSATARGYEFDGSTSKIDIFNDSALQIVGDITIAFWIYIESIPTRTTILDKAYGGEFTINLETAGDLRFYRGTGGGNTTPYSNVDSSVITQNQWVHACATVQGTTVTWYIDGSLDVSGDKADMIGSSSTNDVTIGTGYTGGHLDGRMYDVRLYNQALTAEEVEILHQMTNPNSTQRMKFDRSGVYVKKGIQEG